MRKTITSLSVVIGIVVAGGAGFYLGQENAGRTALRLSYLDDATQVAWQTRILVALERNDREAAIRFLNQMADTKVASLSDYAQGTDRSFRSDIVEALESLRQYRSRTHGSAKEIQLVLEKIR